VAAISRAARVLTVLRERCSRCDGCCSMTMRLFAVFFAGETHDMCGLTCERIYFSEKQIKESCVSVCVIEDEIITDIAARRRPAGGALGGRRRRAPRRAAARGPVPGRCTAVTRRTRGPPARPAPRPSGRARGPLPRRQNQTTNKTR